jgi:hypothetical protein
VYSARVIDAYAPNAQELQSAGAVAAYSLATFGESSGTAAAVLRRARFDLAIDSLPVNFTGRRVLGTALNESIPGPILPALEWRSRIRSSLGKSIFILKDTLSVC